MINISSHCFLPYSQKIADGYYNSSGTFVSNEGYNTTPIMSYPKTPLINKMLFYNNTNSKIRYWSSNSPNQQNQSSYSGDTGVQYSLDRNILKYSIPDLSGEYNVRVLMYKII